MSYTIIPITEADDARDLEVRRAARFIQQHPGMFDRIEYREGLAWGVTIQIDCVQMEAPTPGAELMPIGKTWIEYTTVWTMEAAREALGY